MEQNVNLIVEEKMNNDIPRIDNFEISRSKRGFPVMAERGGGMSNTGYCTIICDRDGKALKPMYIPKGSCNGNHALFVVKRGHYILHGGHNSEHDWLKVFQINSIPPAPLTKIKAKMVGEWRDGDGNIPKKLSKASDAAWRKMYDYHCRSCYYVKE